MKTKIDLPSALFGLCAGVVLMLTIGATYHGAVVGRFQVAGTASHGLVLDTATGRVWSSYLSQTNGRPDQSFFAPKISDRSYTPFTPVK